jgi:hypothetical protein
MVSYHYTWLVAGRVTAGYHGRKVKKQKLTWAFLKSETPPDAGNFTF